jgi:hypothetical protein
MMEDDSRHEPGASVCTHIQKKMLHSCLKNIQKKKPDVNFKDLFVYLCRVIMCSLHTEICL